MAKATIKGADRDNFYIFTKANFKRHAKPKRTPDYVSGSGSMYWYTPNGVIRTSDHWVSVNSCEWTHPDNEGTRTGYCGWSGFVHTPESVTIYVKNPDIFDKWEYEGRDEYAGASYMTIKTSFENCHDGFVWFYGRKCIPSARQTMMIMFDF